MFKKFLSALVVSSLWLSGAAMAQTKQIKVGVIFDMSGPLAAGGSMPAIWAPNTLLI